MLSKEQILGARDHQIREVDVPEWGGTACVRSLSGASRDRIEAAFMANQTEGLKALVVAMSLCDADGNLLFGVDEAEQLQEKSGAVLDRLFEAAWEISGLKAGSLEAAEGN